MSKTQSVALVVFVVALAWAHVAPGGAVAAEGSGPYLHIGYHPTDMVVVEVKLESQSFCESRLALMLKNPEAKEQVSTDTVWCGSDSASGKLAFRGVFRNRITGTLLTMDSADSSICPAAVEAMTGISAPNNKVEVVEACHAK